MGKPGRLPNQKPMHQNHQFSISASGGKRCFCDVIEYTERLSGQLSLSYRPGLTA